MTFLEDEWAHEQTHGPRDGEPDWLRMRSDRFTLTGTFTQHGPVTFTHAHVVARAFEQRPWWWRAWARLRHGTRW